MIPAAESFTEVLTNLQRFMMLHAAALPAHTVDHLLASANHPSPVDRLVNSVEALYAAKGDLNKEGRDITGQMAQFVALNGFHGMQERGQRINQAMNRMGGYTAPAGTSWPDAADDPEPKENYLPEPETPTEPAPTPAPAPEPTPGDEPAA